jgi:hypothetical protein
MGDADMGILGDDRVAVRVSRCEVDGVEFPLAPEGRTREFAPPEGLFLEGDFRALPMLKRRARTPNDDVGAAAHPLGRFVSRPDDRLHLLWIRDRGIAGAVLETHQVARRVAVCP